MSSTLVTSFPYSKGFGDGSGGCGDGNGCDPFSEVEWSGVEWSVVVVALVLAMPLHPTSFHFTTLPTLATLTTIVTLVN